MVARREGWTSPLKKKPREANCMFSWNVYQGHAEFSRHAEMLMHLHFMNHVKVCVSSFFFRVLGGGYCESKITNCPEL